MPVQIRDLMTGPLTTDYVTRRTNEGWIVAAVEWVKPAAGQPLKPNNDRSLDEVPYGQSVSADCEHLIDNAHELDVLFSIYEKVVTGLRPVHIAAELNDRGYRMRPGASWTPNSVFDLMPRLIELSPRLQRRPDWPARRQSLEIVS